MMCALRPMMMAMALAVSACAHATDSTSLKHGATMQQPMTKEQAFDLVSDKGKKFLGTWITVSRKKDQWHISAFSKSANPACYYVVDAQKGTVVYSSENSDGVPAAYRDLPITESYSIEQRDDGLVWVKNALPVP